MTEKTALLNNIDSLLRKSLLQKISLISAQEPLATPDTADRSVLYHKYQANDDEVVLGGINGQYSVRVNGTVILNTENLQEAIAKYYDEISRVIQNTARNKDMALETLGEQLIRNNRQIRPMIEKLGQDEEKALNFVKHMDFSSLNLNYFKKYSPPMAIQHGMLPLPEEMGAGANATGDKPSRGDLKPEDYEGAKPQPERQQPLDESDNPALIAPASIMNSIDALLEKARVYLKPGQQAPQGVAVQRGKRGGSYYEASQATQQPAQMESLDLERMKAYSPNLFLDEWEQSGNDLGELREVIDTVQKAYPSFPIRLDAFGERHKVADVFRSMMEQLGAQNIDEKLADIYNFTPGTLATTMYLSTAFGTHQGIAIRPPQEMKTGIIECKEADKKRNAEHPERPQRFMTGETVGDIVTHELGHYLFYSKGDKFFDWRGFNAWAGSFPDEQTARDTIADKISIYASCSAGEAIAELFVLKMKGQLPDFAKRWFVQ